MFLKKSLIVPQMCLDNVSIVKIKLDLMSKCINSSLGVSIFENSCSSDVTVLLDWNDLEKAIFILLLS